MCDETSSWYGCFMQQYVHGMLSDDCFTSMCAMTIPRQLCFKTNFPKSCKTVITLIYLIYKVTCVILFYFLKLKFFHRLLMVACTPGLFSLLEVFFPEPTGFLLSPLALAGPSVRALAAGLWLLDLGRDRPETWR